jgi:uncharacterized repeat protein (TIGR03803 family)
MHPNVAYKLLYNFGGTSSDGVWPYANLINVNGTLYGTTSQGGTACASLGGCGTVFAITKSGKERVVYSFKGDPDGFWPNAGLIESKGTLYGTTEFGGAYCESAGNDGCGTVFAITTSGKETVLHSFGSGDDGFWPYPGLLNVKGTFYGTTAYGGAISPGFGTVFSITTSGTETVLHSFGKTQRGYDGTYPYAGLVDVKGKLYGTTTAGGPPGCGVGCGTVFAITTSGKENVLYPFKGGPKDGSMPWASLANVDGTLYGTTYKGGDQSDGAVFSVTPSGKESVLHSFAGYPSDGAGPVAGLLNVNGTLYGTTLNGGAYCAPSERYDCGTVFAITTSGSESVLHSFAGYPNDGAYPYASLVEVNGTLYSTTDAGGNSAESLGTVFSLTP